MAGESQLHFFYLDHQANNWERLSAGTRLLNRSEFIKTYSLLPDFQLTLGSNRHMSVFGPRFCVADDEGFVRVSIIVAYLTIVEYNVAFVQGVGNLLCRFERPHVRGLSSSPETFLGSVDALEGQGAQSVLGFHILLFSVSGDRPPDQRRDSCLFPPLPNWPAHV